MVSNSPTAPVALVGLTRNQGYMPVNVVVLWVVVVVGLLPERTVPANAANVPGVFPPRSEADSSCTELAETPETKTFSCQFTQAIDLLLKAVVVNGVITFDATEKLNRIMQSCPAKLKAKIKTEARILTMGLQSPPPR